VRYVVSRGERRDS